MLHPSDLAVDYIWNKLVNAQFSADARHIMKDVEGLVSAASHRPFNPSSEPHQKFLRSQLETAARLEQRASALDLSAVRRRLESTLVPVPLEDKASSIK